MRLLLKTVNKIMEKHQFLENINPFKSDFSIKQKPVN